MAADSGFIDTNILVYASRTRSPFYSRAIDSLRQAGDSGATLWLSRQILREYLAVVTRPQPSQPTLSIADATADVERFLAAFNIAEDGPLVTRRLLDLLARHPSGGRQIHDVNIVATMLAHGITRLVTVNGSDFHRFGGLIECVSI